MSLHTARGARKYVTRAERQRLVAAFMARRSDADLFALTLAWTGARISEVLALTPQAFDVAGGLVAVMTLKRRGPAVREVPIPTELMALLDGRYALSTTQGDTEGASLRLWTFCRATGWRHIKATMKAVGVSGRAACRVACATVSGLARCNRACPSRCYGSGWATRALRRPRSTPKSAARKSGPSPANIGGGARRHEQGVGISVGGGAADVAGQRG